jgi:hypothetical protein
MNQCGTLTARNRDPRANARKVLQGNRALRVFHLCQELFADAMIGVFRKPGFFLREIL